MMNRKVAMAMAAWREFWQDQMRKRESMGASMQRFRTRSFEELERLARVLGGGCSQAHRVAEIPEP